MNQYVFIIGQTPALSIAELLPTIRSYNVIAGNREYLLLETNHIDNAQDFLDHLGGTIKMYEIFPSHISPDDILQNHKTSGKLSYAINIYGKQDRLYQKNLILKAKQNLKNQDISCRFVNKDFKNTTSVQSFHERLVTKGIEIGIFVEQGKNFIGKLIAVQNIESYSHRDYDKPGRNMKVGLMPPKLAQMMINLSCLEQGKTIYDPFCGTGGLLMEAFIMGYKIFGSDVSASVIEQAKINLDWCVKKYSIKPYILNNIFIQDATLFNKSPFRFDAIVTENYLGPVLSHELTEEAFFRMEDHLQHIYIPFFQKLISHINNSIPVVVCFPVFYINNKAFPVRNTLAKIEALGYTASALVPLHIQEKTNIFTTERNSIIYHREGQLVGREIFRLFKK